MPFRRSRRILERVGLVREMPQGLQRQPRSRPKASKPRPRSAQGRPRDPKGHGGSAPRSLALALLRRQRAAGLVSGAFAKTCVFRCKFNDFGGFGHPRIVAGGTGQRRRRQFRGLASSVWGLWRFGSGSWGALGHWAGRPWGILGQNGPKASLRPLVDPKAPGEVFV